ncbi:MAG: carbamoyl-phosphate synthase (glutamine-hydrolyzing) large subunit [Desulfobacteraceae bacterium]|nr:MAG: carbamoyl-phosphate synthase (glutamine-hydrolyzing) large subunit [Desulfobacteraceae bacterium]
MKSKFTDIKKVLVLGSGAIQIGQAGEFDYSGSQAIKALKEEGIETVLINPNIATIQTSENMADQVYFLPLTVPFVEKVILREKPDGILLGFGGQTGLNVGVELSQKGILDAHKVQVLGSPIQAIQNTEDRGLFVKQLEELSLKAPASRAVHNIPEALQTAEQIGYPVMCRIAYALGGLGSGVAYNAEQLKSRAGLAFTYAKQILIEEYLAGWKELEYEVVRDRHNNCIVICSMENIDPMGIHTGESIVVAPVQTLTSAENFKLRSIAIKVVRHLGIVGECNIQFAFDPESDDYRIIEVNARLSRSSALASKATGYPLAFIASKLAVGYGLTEIENMITKETSACFEPALDYVVVKYPRWDLQKFRKVSVNIGSEMKSVGEVMAIARTLEEALQKAIRMLDIGCPGLVGHDFIFEDLAQELKEPTDKRMFAIAAAFQRGYTVDQVYELSRVDRFFLYKIKNIVDLEKELKQHRLSDLPVPLLRTAKQRGFSDQQLARLLGSTEPEVRRLRKIQRILPRVKQIDTLAAEYPARTNYLYLTYNATEDDLDFKESNQVIVLGGGPYRIGSSVEFDWCCVNAVMTLKAMGYQTLMINYNPETVSTDYDICDKLYFDELTLERILDICDKENPLGVIVSMGGQIPNNLALPLHQAGVTILGTSPRDIDQAEDRHKFSRLLDELKISQPSWNELTSIQEAEAFAAKVGYPVLIRPSYVLSGAAMSIALSDEELNKYLKIASKINDEHPVVISKFITQAKEIEIDAMAHKGELHYFAISEHVENAGVHSGDATLVLPPQRTYLETMRKIKIIARKIAKSLNITGPFNIQFIAKDNEVQVIECNLRASRSFPFVSKVVKVNFIDLATRMIMDQPVPAVERSAFDLDYVGVKASQFSFTRLKGSDPILGVEMSSTGEVACLGDDFNEAFLKSLISIGFKLPKKNIFLSTGPIDSKADFLESTRILKQLGFHFYATQGTADFMATNGLKAEILHWPLEKKEPNAMTYLAEGKIELVINIPKSIEKEELDNDYLIRRRAVDFNIPLITNLQLAKRLVETLQKTTPDSLKPKSWKEYV